MPIVTCTQCHTDREVTRIDKRASTLCRKCADFNRRKVFKRVCESCGDVKVVRTKSLSESKRCLKCSASDTAYKMSQANRKTEAEKKRWSSTCSGCGTTRILSSDPSKYRKSDLCGTCSRKAVGLSNIGKPRKSPKKKSKKVTHFRTCPECDDCMQTTLSGSGIKLCRKCSNRSIAKNRKKPKRKPTRNKPKKKYVSKEAIQKEREKNARHRESIKNNDTSKIVKLTPEQERAMIDAYCSSNDVVSVDCKDTYGSTDQMMIIGGY